MLAPDVQERAVQERAVQERANPHTRAVRAVYGRSVQPRGRSAAPSRTVTSGAVGVKGWADTRKDGPCRFPICQNVQNLLVTKPGTEWFSPSKGEPLG